MWGKIWGWVGTVFDAAAWCTGIFFWGMIAYTVVGHKPLFTRTDPSCVEPSRAEESVGADLILKQGMWRAVSTDDRYCANVAHWLTYHAVDMQGRYANTGVWVHL